MALYFAYGSNMLARQMAIRCPGARPAGRAVLVGWRFHIIKGAGANIRPAASGEAASGEATSGVVHGVLWRLEPRHMAMLDKWENVHLRSYRRRGVTVRQPSGRWRHAIAYVSSRHQSGQGRPDYLLSAVIPGARSFGLPERVIEELESWLPRRPIGAAGRRYTGRRR